MALRSHMRRLEAAPARRATSTHMAPPVSSSAVKTTRRVPSVFAAATAPAAYVIAATAPFMSLCRVRSETRSVVVGSYGGVFQAAKSPGGFVSRCPLSTRTGAVPLSVTDAKTLCLPGAAVTTAASAAPSARSLVQTSSATVRLVAGRVGAGRTDEFGGELEQFFLPLLEEGSRPVRCRHQSRLRHLSEQHHRHPSRHLRG